MKKLQCRHDRFPIFAAPPISDRSRELTNSKNGCWLKHTPAVGLDTTDTTKIFQLFFFGVHFIYALNDKQEFSWQKYRSSGTMSDIEQKLS